MQASASGAFGTSMDWMVVLGPILALGFIAGLLMLLLTAFRDERTSNRATKPLPLRITRRESKGHCLMFENGRLVAVFDQQIAEPGERERRWGLELGFDDLDTSEAPTFANLAEAQRWVEQHLRKEQSWAADRSMGSATVLTERKPHSKNRE